MAHYARLDQNNIVTWVTPIDNNIITDENGIEQDFLAIQYIHNTIPGSENYTWKKTSYNGNFRGNYAGIGFHYNESLDAFIPPQDYPSWSLNPSTFSWEPPVPQPDIKEEEIGLFYYIWDEDLYQSGNDPWVLKKYIITQNNSNN